MNVVQNETTNSYSVGLGSGSDLSEADSGGLHCHYFSRRCREGAGGSLGIISGKCGVDYLARH